MAKQILFGLEGRQKLAKGLDTLANAVKATLGPRGRNVAYEYKFGSPKVTKDGVTVAREIDLKDPIENMGAQMVKEVASKTADVAGDGTTTATVLAQAIYREGIKHVTAGANPMELKRGIDLAVATVVEDIKAQSKTVIDQKEIQQVATISANWDTEIGEQIAAAMEKVGRDGVITVEEAKGMESSLEIVEGMSFDRGYISPYLVTDQDKMECILERPFVLVHDKKITTIQSLLPVLEIAAKAQRPILLITEDVEGEALATLVVNKLRGALKVAAVKAPAFGDRRKAMLEDIAIITNANLISEDLGLRIEKVNIDDLGQCQKVIVTKDKCTLVGGFGDPQEIKERIATIKAQIDITDSDFDKDKLKERAAKMAGGVAVIKVGAVTETEMKEKKDRIDDALNATRAAIDEGIVAGGGVALLRAQKAVAAKYGVGGDPKNGDMIMGTLILARSLEEPIRNIMTNAGLEAAWIVQRILENNEVNYGYDAKNMAYVNMIDAGIIDPAKVVRCALQNAASIAGLMLTTECVIAEMEDDKKNQQLSVNPPQMPTSGF